MTMQVYTIYDKVARESGPLFTAKNDSVAWRQFHNAITGKVEVDEHEYQLLKLGTYTTDPVSLLCGDGPIEVFPTAEGLKDA